MIIKNDVIYFKSIPEFFYKERVGIKCNTVRFFNNDEFDLLYDNPPKRIHICEPITDWRNYRSFVRDISDISYIKLPNIPNVWGVIFSWLG